MKEVDRLMCINTAGRASSQQTGKRSRKDEEQGGLVRQASVCSHDLLQCSPAACCLLPTTHRVPCTGMDSQSLGGFDDVLLEHSTFSSQPPPSRVLMNRFDRGHSQSPGLSQTKLSQVGISKSEVGGGGGE